MAAIEVRVDPALRVAGALLAAGEWPAREQAARPYQPHAVAILARRRLAGLHTHPAVQAAWALTQADVGSALGLYQAARAGDWPASLEAHLASFSAAGQLESLWTETDADWSAAAAEVGAVLERGQLGQFLADLLGPLKVRLSMMPNLLYPGQQNLALVSAAELLVCLPPPLAWGSSPPWRYDQRPDEVLAAAAETFAATLFFLAQPFNRHARLFGLAAAVVCLTEAEGPAAGRQLLLMEQKARGLPQLPACADWLAQTLADRRAGRVASLDQVAAQINAQPWSGL